MLSMSAGRSVTIVALLVFGFVLEPKIDRAEIKGITVISFSTIRNVIQIRVKLNCNHLVLIIKLLLPKEKAK
jgi:hypothetical protein